MKKKVLLPAVVGVLFGLTLTRLDFLELWRSAMHIPPGAIAGVMLLQIISQLLVNLQWHRTAGEVGIGISFRDMLRVNCEGSVVESIVPGGKIGGDVARAIRIDNAAKCGRERAATLPIVQKTFGMSVFALFFAFSVLMGSGALVEVWQIASAAGVLLVAFGTALCFGRVRVFLRGVLGRVRAIRARSVVLLFLLSAVIWGLYPLKLYILAYTLGADIGFLQVVAAVFVAYMVAMLPIFPGGIGGFEGSLTAILVAGGVVFSEALVLAVLFRFVTFWFVMLISSAVVCGFKVRARVKEVSGA